MHVDSGILITSLPPRPKLLRIFIRLLAIILSHLGRWAPCSCNLAQRKEQEEDKGGSVRVSENRNYSTSII
uniref:Uncharacterized protein n=1 Tax=Setaria italica TaxID=4555 RepID=K3Z1B0_SETIT